MFISIVWQVFRDIDLLVRHEYILAEADELAFGHFSLACLHLLSLSHRVVLHRDRVGMVLLSFSSSPIPQVRSL